MRRGYPGMGGQNMNQMMKQMEKMQKELTLRIQEGKLKLMARSIRYKEELVLKKV